MKKKNMSKYTDLYSTRPTLKRKWSYWFNLLLTGYTKYSDYENFSECLAYEMKIVKMNASMKRLQIRIVKNIELYNAIGLNKNDNI